jgi:thiol oxidase
MNYLGHNKVNKRLQDEDSSNDPAWPKVQFPTKEQCNSCVRKVDENNDAIEYDENETYNFLKNYYSVQISGKKNTAINQQYNRLLLLSLFPLMLFATL